MYNQLYPYNGLLVRSEKTLNGQLLTESSQTHFTKDLNGGQTKLPYNASTTTNSYDLDGTPISDIVQTTELDNYGNATRSHTETSDITGTYTKTVDNDFDNSVGSWILGKL